MKKFLLLFFALFAMTFFAKAQVPVLTEDFEGSSIPSGWTTIDADNDGSNWEHSSVQEEIGGYNSNGSVVSHSYDNNTYDALFPDNWLISPAINLSGTSSLSFWFVVAQAYPADHFGVYISTTSATDTSAFTSIFDYTPTSANGTWTQQTIDLTSYAGNTVHIAFRHFDCTDQFLLALDDIVVYSGTTETMLTVNPSTVNFGMVNPNDHSTVASVVVTGYNTTAAISATVSAPFEISDNNTTNFGSSVTLPAAGGTLYVRYSPTNEGADNGTVSLTSGTASASVTLTGTAVDCNIALPYTETFAATSGSRNCWTLVSNNEINIGGTNGLGYLTVDGRDVLQFSSYGSASDYNQYAFSPRLNVSSSATNLNVSVVYGTRASDYLYFGYITDTDTIWDSTPYNTNSTYSTYNWETETFVIPATATQLAVHYYGNYQYYAWIDNVEITEMTTDYCFPVNNLTASNVTAHEATLTWSGNANNYTIYNMADTSTITTVNDTTYNLTDLTSDTQYSFGVVANCTSGNSNMVIVNLHTQISCPAPTGINVTYNPNEPTEVTLNWTENGTATNWQIVLNGDETNIIDVNQKPYTLTNLTIDSIYTVKVRAYCDVDDQSAWSTTTSFEPTTKTVIGSGNATNNYLPTNCYFSYSLTQQIYTIDELGDAGLIESIDFYNNSGYSRTRDLSIYVVSTAKDTFANNTDWISASNADLQFSGSVTFAPQAWTSIQLNGFIYDGLSNIAIIVDDNTGDYSSNTPFLAFSSNQQALRIYSDPTNYDVNSPTYSGTIENTKNQIRLAKSSLIGCVKPTAFTINYLGGDEAEVSWNSDAPSFNISVNNVVTNNVTSPYTLTGLDLNTTYTVSVQAVCDATSTSDWTNPASFTTDACMLEDQCNITIVGADSYGDGWNGNAINIIQNGVTIGTFTLNTGSNYTETYSVCTGIPVSFSWIEGLYAYEASFEIRDGGNSVVYIGNGTDLVEDSIFFTLNSACPSCMPATELTVDTTTENSITISWTGTAASYDIYNGENFVENVTTTSYTFTGLTPASNYVFGVQAICSANDSATVATINAMTECADITTLPYNEGFENGLGCWTTVNGSSDGMPWSVINNASYAHSGTNAAASFSYNSGAIHANAWLISPKFVLPNVSNDSLSFSWWHKVNSYFPTELYDVKISTTTNDTAAFTATLLSVSPDSVDEYVHNMVDLTPYAGQEVYIAFHHHDSYDQNYLLIDDISLFEGGYVPPAPDTLTVTFEVDDATMGTTIPAPGTYLYLDGDTIYFGSQANAGFHFLKWEITLGGQTQEFGPQYANGYYVLASSWMHYETVVFKAFFEAGLPDSTTITYAVNDPTMGTITPAPGTYTIYVGDAITATATPNNGYVLSAWLFDIYISGTLYSRDTILSTDAEFDNPMNFGSLPQTFADYDATITITAVFEMGSTPGTQYIVTLNTADATMGTVSPAGANTVNEGSSFTATAIANDGYHFVNWTDNNGNTFTTNPYTFTVNGNTTLTATFEANDPVVTYFNVTVTSADPNMGNVSSTHSGPVAENTVVTVTAIANTGYRFVNWTNDAGTEVSTNNEYTFTVTADIALIANFELEDGINDIDASNVLIYANNSTIYVRGAEGHDVFVYDMNGRCIYQHANASETETISMSSAGIYMVRIDNAIFKKVVIVK